MRPETSCMKGTCVHIKNVGIKQRCYRKVPDFAMFPAVTLSAHV